jgi:hypothetical protein
MGMKPRHQKRAAPPGDTNGKTTQEVEGLRAAVLRSLDEIAKEVDSGDKCRHCGKPVDGPTTAELAILHMLTNRFFDLAGPLLHAWEGFPEAEFGYECYECGKCAECKQREEEREAFDEAQKDAKAEAARTLMDLENQWFTYRNDTSLYCDVHALERSWVIEYIAYSAAYRPGENAGP